MFGRLLLYFNTLRHLRFKQLAYNFVRRAIKPSIPASCLVKSNPLFFHLSIKYSNKIDGQSVCFLNDRVTLEQTKDWTCLNKPKLWRYNLHYFDYLLDDGAGPQLKDELINNWILASPQLKEDAWEPYVLSLRIVNWIKYFIHYKNNNVPDAWLQSLHSQAVVLSNTIEYHILANHYLKNGKGLLFAGAYLKSDRSYSWYELGKKILLEEAVEQILPDGGHYEKSPMYHCIVVEDYLDVINLIKSNSLDVSKNALLLLESKTKSALNFLSKILMPDGNIPLFNDSAFGIAPSPAMLFNYAEQVMSYDNHLSNVHDGAASLPDSGYFCIKDGNSKIIIDCGSVSPEYQPGHTHCDLLSYELALNGKRVIVDTGVYDYENSDARCYSRSTRAHNTVVIDGNEQSELWGQFRVARRAEVDQANLFRNCEASDVFIGSYTPFWGKRQNITHKRTVRHSGDTWEVTDEITGCGSHKVTNYIHLHPHIIAKPDGKNFYLECDGVGVAKLSFSDDAEIHCDNAWYYPEFGIKTKAIVITLKTESVLPIRQCYSLEKL